MELGDGEIRGRFSDEFGNPVRDVRCVLLPVAPAERIMARWFESDLLQRALAAGLERRSDASGWVRWQVPPGLYRWAAFLSKSLVVDPPFERTSIRTQGRAIVSDSSVPRQVSGVMNLERGMDLRFASKVHTGTGFVAYIDAGDDRLHGGRIRARVFDRVHRDVPAGGGAILLEFESETELEGSGRIEFLFLSPGEKLLTVRWQTEEGRHTKDIRRLLRIEPGRIADLGALVCEDVGLRVVCIGEPDEDMVSVTVARPADTAASPYHHTARTVGGRATFQGMPKGTCVVRVHRGPVLVERKVEVSAWHEVVVDWAAEQLQAERAPADDFVVEVPGCSGSFEVTLLLADGRLRSRRAEATRDGRLELDRILDRDGAAAIAVLVDRMGTSDAGGVGFAAVLGGARSARVDVREPCSVELEIVGEANVVRIGPRNSGFGMWGRAVEAGKGGVFEKLPADTELSIYADDSTTEVASIHTPGPGARTKVVVEVR